MKEEGYQIQQIPWFSPKSLVRSSTDNLWYQTYSYPLANTLTPLSSMQIWYPPSDNGTGELQLSALRTGSPERGIQTVWTRHRHHSMWRIRHRFCTVLRNNCMLPYLLRHLCENGPTSITVFFAGWPCVLPCTQLQWTRTGSLVTQWYTRGKTDYQN